MVTPGKSSQPDSPTHTGIQRPHPRRYEPTPVYRCAEHLKREGMDLNKLDGAWRPTQRPLRRPGRNAERAIPIVTNGAVEIAVDTAEHAADLSGFLNAVGLDHLDPVPNLRPPDQDLVRD
jgi:hypothetical protein